MGIVITMNYRNHKDSLASVGLFYTVTKTLALFWLYDCIASYRIHEEVRPWLDLTWNTFTTAHNFVGLDLYKWMQKDLFQLKKGDVGMWVGSHPKSYVTDQ
jgi:hypothetical protein